jgi:hypothetical protein
MRYASIRQLLSECLERDAELHVRAPNELGRSFDTVDPSVPRDDPDLALAIAFWDSWIDERNHGFPGHYRGISIDDWPILARSIAASLVSGRTIDDSRVRKNFDFRR